MNEDMSYNKEYTVYFTGKVVVEAETEAEADGMAYDILHDAGIGTFDLTETEEGECAECGGTGEVDAMEQVYPNEPHMAPIGTQKCICKVEE